MDYLLEADVAGNLVAMPALVAYKTYWCVIPMTPAQSRYVRQSLEF